MSETDAQQAESLNDTALPEASEAVESNDFGSDLRADVLKTLESFKQESDAAESDVDAPKEAEAPIVEEAAPAPVVVPPEAPKLFKDNAELWAKAPPEVQQAIVSYEKERAEVLGPIDHYIAKYKDGTTAADVVNDHYEFQQILAKSPVDFVHRVCARAGLDPVQLAKDILGGTQAQPAAPAPQPDAPQDPAYTQLSAALQRQQAELAALRQESYNATKSSLDAAIKAFQETPDAALLAEVQDGFVEHLGLILAKNGKGDMNKAVREAYQAAVAATPAAREKFLAAQLAAKQKEAADAAKAKAEKARLAARSVRGIGSPISLPDPTDQSVAADVRRTLQSLRSVS